MSYDLAVFDPASGPRDRDAFIAWFDHEAEWAEGHSYEDAEVTTPELRAWYRDMSEVWFPMNGPDSPLKNLAPGSPLWDDDRVTGYTIGRSMIYCNFRWSKAEEAREAVVRLAEKHGVGFFDASGDGRVVFPGETSA